MGSITPQNPAQSEQSSLNQLESGRQQIMSYLESHTRVSPPLSLDELENIVQNLQARYRTIETYLPQARSLYATLAE